MSEAPFMNDVEKHARQIVDCGGPLRGVSVAVLRRAIQMEKKHAMPRTGFIRLMVGEMQRREREDASAPKDAA